MMPPELRMYLGLWTEAVIEAAGMECPLSLQPKIRPKSDASEGLACVCFALGCRHEEGLRRLYSVSEGNKMRASEVRSHLLPPETANMYLTAIVEEDGDGFVALCPELDVASQGESVEQATDNLREAVELLLSCADPAEISSRLKTRVYVTHFEARGGAA